MKFSKLSIIAISAIIFAGCSNTPGDAVSNMYDALQDGNSVKLANNVEESASIVLMSESLKKCTISNKMITNDIKRTNECLKQEYENLKYENIEVEKVSDDNAYVKVRVIKDDESNDIAYEVKKIDGKWMVMGRKKQ